MEIDYKDTAIGRVNKEHGEYVQVKRLDLVGFYADRVSNLCTTWAITFANEHEDDCIVDIGKFRKGLLDLAEEAEKKRAELLFVSPRDIQGIAESFLRAMKRGKHRRAYTYGLTATFK